MTALFRMFEKTQLSSYAHAREILETDFVSTEDVAQVIPDIEYSLEQQHSLAETLPNKTSLEWFLNKNMILVPGPHIEMSLLDVCHIHRDHYFGEKNWNDVWYEEKTEDFAQIDKVTPGWYALGREPLEDSFEENWEKQQHRVRVPMSVPNAAELAWILVAYRAIHKHYLLEKVHVRTASLDSNGNHVISGCFNEKGLDIEQSFDIDEESKLGIVEYCKF